MRNRIIGLVLTCLLAVGAATAGQKELQADIDEILVQLLQLQREHGMLRDQLDGQADQLRQVLATRDEDSRVSQADQFARIDEIGRQLEILAQKLDDTNYRLSALSAEMQASRSLWERSLAAGGTSVAAGESEPDATKPEGAAPAEQAPLDPLALSGGSPEQIFNTAYADYTKGNYPLAILGFQEYLEKFPGSDFADDALYWIGESYYSQGKFTDALQAFAEVIRRYPDGDKVPAAHLKRAYAFLESNQTAQGVVQLNALIEEFPGSDEARLARERLRNLGLRD